MNVRSSNLDSLNSEFNQHWQQAPDEGDCAVIIDTTQKALQENATTTHHVENKLFFLGCLCDSCSSADKEVGCPAISLVEEGYIDVALQIDMEGQDPIGCFNQEL